jgi:hypothetical protein
VNLWLWLDAISIDQTDISERNHQVALMKDIYTQAHRVLIYARESGDESDRLLRYLSDYKFELPTLDVLKTLILDRQGLGYALKALLARPWFQRTWVVQEAYLATRATFIVGEMSLDWTLLHKKRLTECALLPCSGLEMLPGVLEWMDRQLAKDIDLYFALTTTRTCLASDARDKVFALLSLLSIPVGFEADYNWTYKEVFALTAAHLITSLNTLDVLCYAGQASVRSYVPSWAPLWSSESGRSLTAQFVVPGNWSSHHSWHYDSEMARLSPSPPHELPHPPPIGLGSAMTLVVEGTQIDKVQYSFGSEYIESNCPPGSWFLHTCSAKQYFFGRILRLAKDQRNQHNFIHSVYPLRFRSKAQCDCIYCSGQTFGKCCNSTPRKCPRASDTFVKNEFTAFLEQSDTQGVGRQNFGTEHTLGIGLRETRSGDTIWRLQGAAMPFVLRAFGDQYQVIGPCYVHGAEKLRDHDIGGNQLVWRRIILQ